MRAIVCHELGSVEGLRLEERPIPEPGPSQVLVKVSAAGVSYVDALRVTGKYQFPLSPPFVPGGELAGTVAGTGADVAEWKAGDPVLGIAQGAYAEYALADAAAIQRLPGTLDFPRGASFLQAYTTAWFALTRRSQIQGGEFVMVTGAGGGVGLAAIDVARSLGAQVIAVASSAAKREQAMAMGAVAAINAHPDTIRSAAKQLTNGTGVDTVYDVAGGELSEAALRTLKFHGRMLVVGFPAGIARIPLNLVLLRNREVIGVELGSWMARHPASHRQVTAELVDAVAAGRLRPATPNQVPLADAASALADLLDRRAVGKTVLVC